MTLTPEQRSSILLSNLDDHDCGVIALQAVTGMPHAKAKRLAVKHGYDPDIGSPRLTLPAVLVELGFDCTPVDVPLPCTPSIFAMDHEDGKYLVYIEKHVMALVDGDLYNSRGYWSAPLEFVLEVTE